MAEKKDLEYWRNNAEESYRNTPICVLKYIGELEEAVKNTKHLEEKLNAYNEIDKRYEEDVEFEIEDPEIIPKISNAAVAYIMLGVFAAVVLAVFITQQIQN